jgi:hypothetical protein
MFIPKLHTFIVIRAQRTDRIVLEHAQRLMDSWTLHRAVVARHGHGDQAHHDGAGFRYCVSAQCIETGWGSTCTFFRHGDAQLCVVLATMDGCQVRRCEELGGGSSGCGDGPIRMEGGALGFAFVPLIFLFLEAALLTQRFIFRRHCL